MPKAEDLDLKGIEEITEKPFKIETLIKFKEAILTGWLFAWRCLFYKNEFNADSISGYLNGYFSLINRSGITPGLS